MGTIALTYDGGNIVIRYESLTKKLFTENQGGNPIYEINVVFLGSQIEVHWLSKYRDILCRFYLTNDLEELDRKISEFVFNKEIHVEKLHFGNLETWRIHFSILYFDAPVPDSKWKKVGF